MKPKPAKDLILKSLKEKAAVKFEIFSLTSSLFKELKSVLIELQGELRAVSEKQIKSELAIEYKDKGQHEAEFRIAEDIIVFWMLTDIFSFDREHVVWKTSYVEEDPSRAYCGMICVYNFLTDSFKYNRVKDVGYLIARIFVNKDRHFFVEGKRQLGFLYNDFENAVLDRNSLKSVLESSILYSLDFDLYSPPYEEMKQISVSEIIEATSNQRMSTGKRLGFRFHADDDLPE